MPESLGNPEKAVLIALLLAGREVSGPELKRRHGVEMRKPTRERLNTAKLVESNKKGRAYVHQITERGIEECEGVLASGERSTGTPALAGVCFELFVPLVAHLRQRGLGVADVLLESDIRRAYGELSKRPQDMVSLVDLRSKLDGAAARDDVDRVLRAMTRTGLVHLWPSSNRKGLTDDDRAAAVRIGSEDKHLMVIEES